MLLEHLPAQHLREQVSWVEIRRDMLNFDLTSASQLSHLEHLPIYVTTVLSGCHAVAQVMRCLVVGEHLHRLRDLVPDRVQHADDEQQLNGAVGECNEFGLARAHGDAVLAAGCGGDGRVPEHDAVPAVVERVSSQLLSAY